MLQFYQKMKTKITSLLLLLFLVVGLSSVFGAESVDETRKKAEADVAVARKYAELGVAAAQNNLGVMYANGDGVQKDIAEAAKWFRKAAERGSADAQYHLGIMYTGGNGVPKDSAEAAKWFRKSAEQGNAGAQHNLGFLYWIGEGVLKDFVQAHAWYNNASANGRELSKEHLSGVEKLMTPEQKAEAMKLAREILERIEAKKK